MLRLSSYLIISDRLRNGGYALLGGLSGSIELINEDLYELITQLRNKPPHELYINEHDFPDELLEKYIKRGFITELSHPEERQLLSIIATALHERETAKPTVVIVPELDCNYRCVYCFERSWLDKLPSAKSKMDLAEVAAVYKAIEQIPIKNGNKIEQVILFGGEPLLQANKQLVQRIVEQGRAIGLRFMAVTNGHDLEGYLDLLGKEKIAALQITIDGPAAIHDKRRIARDGSSSFAKIIANMRRALCETKVQITIRINLDQENYSALKELLDIFKAEKWLNNQKVLINVAIVHQKDTAGLIIPQHDINNVRGELLEMVDEYSNIEIGSAQASHNEQIFSSLLVGKPYALRSSFCAASCGMYVFMPGGRISSCWESLNNEDSYIGHYTPEGLSLNEQRVKHRFGRSAAKIPQCADCKFCLICGGGCSTHAECEFHDVYQPHCDDFPQTYSWVLADAVENYLKINGL